MKAISVLITLFSPASVFAFIRLILTQSAMNLNALAFSHVYHVLVQQLVV